MMSRKKWGACMILAGLLFMGAALSLTAYNLWDEYRAGREVQKILRNLPRQEAAVQEAAIQEAAAGSEETEIPDYILNPQMEMPVREIDGNEYIGILDIPALDLSLPVMSAWSDRKLKISPCLYAGSAYTDTMVIAGHNYRTHFSGLKSLPLGEEIRFTDVDGNCFLYKIAEVEILKPEDIREMTDSNWDLSLFTCTYDSQNRFTVRCQKVIQGKERFIKDGL